MTPSHSVNDSNNNYDDDDSLSLHGRQQQEQAQKILFQKAKLISFLIENFVSPSTVMSKEALSKCSSPQERDLLTRRISCRGLIMNCSNAIRLQLNSQNQSNNCFLNNFLKEHPKWKDFVEQLKASYVGLLSIKNLILLLSYYLTIVCIAFINRLPLMCSCTLDWVSASRLLKRIAGRL